MLMFLSALTFILKIYITIGENIIGAPTKRNNYGAIQLLILPI